LFASGEPSTPITMRTGPGDCINFDREMFTVERIAGRTIRRVRMTLPEVPKKTTDVIRTV
jgi:hypothetical protein